MDENPADALYQAGLETAVKTASNTWTVLVMTYVQKESATKTEVTAEDTEDEENAATSEDVDQRKSKEEISYKPKELLSTEEGIVGFKIWQEQAKTFFLMSGHNK